MISKNNQYLKKWPAAIIEIVNVVHIVWKVEDRCYKGFLITSHIFHNRLSLYIIIIEYL